MSPLPVLIGLDEFPVGYSLAGRPPAEPASASPTGNDSQQPTLPYNDFSANGNNPLNFVSQPKGALHLEVRTPDLYPCQSPSIQSPQQLELPLGTAQTLANTRKTKLRWIEERIGVCGDFETNVTPFSRQQDLLHRVASTRIPCGRELRNRSASGNLVQVW